MPVRWSVLASTAALAILSSVVVVDAPASAGRVLPSVSTQSAPGWALDRIDQRRLPLNHAYRSRSNGSGVTVYVVDCGAQVGNPAFGGRGRRGPNFAKGPWADCTDSFAVGHATFVAGIVGGRVTGVANAVRLVSVRALKGGEGVGVPPMRVEAQRVIHAIDWVISDAAKKPGPAVVNLSLAFPERFVGVSRAMHRLERAHITAVVAAGNDSGDACQHTPARVPTVLTVGAVNRTDRRWSGSNTGPCVDLFAPGVSVRSVLSGGGVFSYRGSGATSWATPYVTGTAALYLSTHPGAHPPDVRRWILSSSTKGLLTGLPAGTSNRLLYAFAPLRGA
ncbi:MAG: S8 family peptidase [Actinomycetes bacterium]